MHFVLEEALEPAEIHELADGPRLPAVAQQVANGGADWIPAGQGSKVLEMQSPAGLLDRGEQDVGGVQAGFAARASMRVLGAQRRCGDTPRTEHGLEGEAMDMREL